jgi:hypothetical protein
MSESLTQSSMRRGPFPPARYEGLPSSLSCGIMAALMVASPAPVQGTLRQRA